MITGTHLIIYSIEPEKDREFFLDVLKFPFVDAGDGWLIFRLPPSEVAIHPSTENNLQELYLMCDDIDQLVNQMKELNIKCSKIQKQPWGKLTEITLPGGGNLKIYQPMHNRPV
jgi:hypothetical protein